MTSRHDGPMLVREESLGYQVNHLARLLAQALRLEIAPRGVVPGQFPQLLALFEQDGLTQRELCERIRVEQPTMANTLQRMERDGLIRREPDPADGRRTRVRLTQHARALERPLAAAAWSVNAAATRGLSEHEIDDFMRLMAQIIDNLQQTPAAAGGRGPSGQTHA